MTGRERGQGFRLPFLSRQETRRYLRALVGVVALAFVLGAVLHAVEWVAFAVFAAYLVVALPWIFDAFDRGSPGG